MAKALLGHVGGLDPRLLAEVAVLRRRVTDLEAEVLRLSAENDEIRHQQSGPDEVISLDDKRESVAAAALA
jgi:hypothetical protein